MTLIDTSVWIQYLRRPGDESVRDVVARLLDANQAACCPIIVMEILRGAPSKKVFEQLRNNLLALPFITISDKVWDSCYNLGYNLKMKGVIVPPADLIIAAAAIHNNIPVLHRDKHFELIAKHSPLQTLPV